MKKLYSFVAFMVMAAFGFMGYAQAIDGIYYVKGSFYTASASSDVNPRVRAFEIQYGDYSGEYASFSVLPEDNPFNIKAQNESQQYYVYLNGERLESTEAGTEVFGSQVSFADGDVVKLFSYEPFVSNVEIGFMQPNSEVQGAVEVTMDCVVPVTDIYDGKTKVLEGTRFDIKATEGNTIANVYVNNEDIYPVDGVYSFTANTKGDMLVIIDMAQTCKAQAMVSGEFYTFTAQSAANNRIEPLFVHYSTYDCQYIPFTFSAGDNPFILKGQNASQQYYVYLNGEAVANSEAGVMSNTFDAEVTLADNDVLKIYNHEPFYSTVAIDFMDPRSAVYDRVNVLIDGVTPAEGLDKDGSAYKVLEGTRFDISAADRYRITAVYVGDEEVEPVDGVYTVVADLEGTINVRINMSTIEEGVFFIDGAFYTASVQSVENNRVEPVSISYGEYTNDYRYFAFDPDMNPFVIKAQNEAQTYYVYINGEEVPNSQAGEMANMFDAEVDLAPADVVKVYDHAPFVSKVAIDVAEADAAKVVVKMDNIVVVDLAETSEVKALEGTKFEVMGANGGRIASVSFCGEEVEPVEGIYTVYVAEEGLNQLVITLVEKAEGMAYIQGQFYTFVAQAEANNRIEPIDVQYGTYAEYRPFSFSTGDNPFNLKGVNEGNNFYVYLNGEQIENTPEGEMHEMYESQVSFAAGDVLKVYSKQPFQSNVVIDLTVPESYGGSLENDLNVVVDRITPVNLKDTYEASLVVLEGTEFQISGVPTNKVRVLVNDEPIEDVAGVFTVVADHQGDINVEILLSGPDGISGVIANKAENSDVYNMQGMLIYRNASADQISALRSGMYVIGGQKVIVR